MTVIAPRSSPSGPLGAPFAAQFIGYTLLAPFELVVLAAGHVPGLYELRLGLNVRATSTSVINRIYTYSAPGVGLNSTQTSGSGSLNVLGGPINPGSQFQTGSTLISDGRLPIKLQLTPTLVGSPIVDVYGGALLFSRLIT